MGLGISLVTLWLDTPRPLPMNKVNPALLLTTGEKEGKGSTRSWADCQVLSDELEIGAAQKWADLFLLYLSLQHITTTLENIYNSYLNCELRSNLTWEQWFKICQNYALNFYFLSWNIYAPQL